MDVKTFTARESPSGVREEASGHKMDFEKSITVAAPQKGAAFLFMALRLYNFLCKWLFTIMILWSQFWPFTSVDSRVESIVSATAITKVIRAGLINQLRFYCCSQLHVPKLAKLQ